MRTVILSFLIAFVIAYLLLRPLLNFALQKGLCDEPLKRSSHDIATPHVGGLGIFAGFILSVFLFIPTEQISGVPYLLGALIIVFLLGVTDDLKPISGVKKILVQTFAAVLIVVFADIRIHSFYQFVFGIDQLPYWFSCLFSVLVTLTVINAFNLIDGINGLATSLGVVSTFVLGFFLFLSDSPYLILATASTGAYLAFLPYNCVKRPQAFMGDAGSLTLGTIVAILTIVFIDTGEQQIAKAVFAASTLPVWAIAVVFVPLYDALRLFFTRLSRGISPLKPDRFHIHHLLIDSGYTHTQATGILVVANLGILLLTFGGQFLIPPFALFAMLCIVASMAVWQLHRSVHPYGR